MIKVVLTRALRLLPKTNHRNTRGRITFISSRSLLHTDQRTLESRFSYGTHTSGQFSTQQNPRFPPSEAAHVCDKACSVTAAILGEPHWCSVSALTCSWERTRLSYVPAELLRTGGRVPSARNVKWLLLKNSQSDPTKSPGDSHSLGRSNGLVRIWTHHVPSKARNRTSRLVS